MADADGEEIAVMDDMEDAIGALDDVEGAAEEAAADPLAVLLRHHPECRVDYRETVAPKINLLASPPLDKDPNHRSPPFLTQYEKTKILGLVLISSASPLVRISPSQNISQVSGRLPAWSSQSAACHLLSAAPCPTVITSTGVCQIC